MKLKRREFLYCLGGILAACVATEREPDYTVVIGHESTFDPASLSVPIGSVVAWHNRSANVHAITTDSKKAQIPERILLPSDATPFDSGDLFSGERWAYTFDMPGNYVYICRYHEQEEMVGVITVTS